MADRKSTYDRVTDSILGMLDKGIIPWRKPWVGDSVALPLRATGTPYRGINVWTLGFTAMEQGFTSPVWATFKQIKKWGGSVQKGQKGSDAVYFDIKDYEVIDEATGKAEKKRSFFLRFHSVFNLDQTKYCELPASLEELVTQPKAEGAGTDDQCEALISDFRKIGPKVAHKGNSATYNPRADLCTMPSKASFESTSGYYSTLFHEYSHSTGHSSRLDRKEVGTETFGQGGYGKEELVAEFSASYLSALAGIDRETVKNSAAYIQHWRKAIEADSRLVVQAAASAQKASDFILGAEGTKDGDKPEPKAPKAKKPAKKRRRRKTTKKKTASKKPTTKKKKASAKPKTKKSGGGLAEGKIVKVEGLGDCVVIKHPDGGFGIRRIEG